MGNFEDELSELIQTDRQARRGGLWKGTFLDIPAASLRDYCSGVLTEKTLAHLHRLWGRCVVLETSVEDEPCLFTSDEAGFALVN